MAEPSPIIVARFWSKVHVGRAAECWLWTASLDRHGYGQFKGASYVSPKRAHRVAYELVHGGIPAGMVLRHRCNHPACCNPDHLVPGSQAENHVDREVAGNCHREAGRFVENGAASED